MPDSSPHIGNRLESSRIVPPRKSAHLALLILCAGILLLMPPLIWIFNKPFMAFGIPLPALYVFGVWLALVVGALALTRILPRDD